MVFKELMKDFARRVGAEELEKDEDGVRRVAVDDMVLFFREVVETDEVLTWAEVCELPPGDRDRLCRVLLEAQFMGQSTQGSMFSIDAGSGRVYLHRLDPLKLLDADAFFAVVERFVNVLEQWRRLIQDYRAAPAEDASNAASAPEASPGFGSDAFLRV